jgi:hypothetical protein
MTTAAMSRQMLHSQLRRVALRLLARQALRACASGILWGSVAAVCGVLLLVVLPNLLALEFSAGRVVAALGAIGGFATGAYRVLRQNALPGFEDAALALESRLNGGDAALATALQLKDGDRFEAPVLQSASRALAEALGRPAPHVLPLKSLLIAPPAALLAVVALVWGFGVEPPSGGSNASQATNSGSFSIDVATTRTAADREAVETALGMKKAAAAMNKAAQTLRSADATESERQAALDDAREAASASGEPKLVSAAAEMPEAAPSTPSEREKLAARMEALAGNAGDLSGNTDGSAGAGSGGDLDVTRSRDRLVPFPAIERREGGGTGELALQTPQRRALAQRAMIELEGIRNR